MYSYPHTVINLNKTPERTTSELTNLINGIPKKKTVIKSKKNYHPQTPPASPVTKTKRKIDDVTSPLQLGEKTPTRYFINNRTGKIDETSNNMVSTIQALKKLHPDAPLGLCLQIDSQQRDLLNKRGTSILFGDIANNHTIYISNKKQKQNASIENESSLNTIDEDNSPYTLSTASSENSLINSITTSSKSTSPSRSTSPDSDMFFEMDF